MTTPGAHPRSDGIWASSPADPAAMREILAVAEPLHRQLRPVIPDDYVDYLETMHREGARLALLFDDGAPRALAVYRTLTTTFHGRRFYVDDLVADEHHRGHGYGGRLMEWLEAEARRQGADTFALDSGVQRAQAHKFYFNQGMSIFSYSFAKPLK